MHKNNLTVGIIIPIITCILAACSGLPADSSTGSAALFTFEPYRTRTALPAKTLPSTAAPALLLTPTPTLFVYRVQKDELGSAIAYRYGISLAELQSANPDVNLNFLRENQELVIPPPLATRAPDLSSPTPAALSIPSVTCYPAAEGEGICLALIRNDQPAGLMYITGSLILEGGSGTRQEPFSALVDTLPAGRQIPIYARFPAPFPYPYRVELVINTAIQQAQDYSGAGFEIVDQSVQYSQDRLSAKVTGTIRSGQPTGSTLAIVAAGYRGDTPAGIRRQEIQLNQETTFPLPFEIWVYSVGPRMDRVDLFVESY